MKKTELIHVRIDPVTKKESEEILDKLGVNMSYAVSMFLNQVIMRRGFPFDIEVTEETDAELFARVGASTGGNGKISDANRKILHLYATGQIDRETAVFAINKSFDQ